MKITLHERFVYDTDTDMIGEGGFSKVYKAFDLQTQNHLALKIATITKIDEKYSLFGEVKRAIDFDSPYLVKYYGYFIDEYEDRSFGKVQRPVVVMEYVNAGCFKDYLNQMRQDKHFLNTLLIAILDGLDYLHSRGFVHRDIKPQNILMQNQAGELIPKISDFGISKDINSENSAVSQATVGTYEYMSPEQISGKKLNGQTDLWAFGVMLHYIFSDKMPFGARKDGIDDSQIIQHISQQRFMYFDRNIPQPYQNIILKCLQHDQAQRYQSAKEIIEDLKKPSTEVPKRKEVFTEYEKTVMFGKTKPEEPIQSPKTVIESPAIHQNREQSQGSTVYDNHSQSGTQHQPPPPIQPTFVQPEGKNKNKQMIAVLLTVLVLAIGAFFTYQHFNKVEEKEKTAEVKPKEKVDSTATKKPKPEKEEKKMPPKPEVERIPFPKSGEQFFRDINNPTIPFASRKLWKSDFKANFAKDGKIVEMEEGEIMQVFTPNEFFDMALTDVGASYQILGEESNAGKITVLRIDIARNQ